MKKHIKKGATEASNFVTDLAVPILSLLSLIANGLAVIKIIPAKWYAYVKKAEEAAKGFGRTLDEVEEMVEDW